MSGAGSTSLLDVCFDVSVSGESPYLELNADIRRCTSLGRNL